MDQELKVNAIPAVLFPSVFPTVFTFLCFLLGVFLYLLFVANSLVYWLAYFVSACSLRFALHCQITLLYLQCVSLSRSL